MDANARPPDVQVLCATQRPSLLGEGDATHQRLWHAAHLVWPTLAVPFENFALELNYRSTQPHPSTDLDPAEVLLALACVAGEPAALALFEKTYLLKLRFLLMRIVEQQADVEEVFQDVRAKLLLASDGERPRILDCAGRGELGGLVKVIATRTALNLRRANLRRRTDMLSDELANLVTPNDELIRAEHRALLKAAMAHAYEQLGARERVVLRMHLVEGLSIDLIGRALEIHRATAARWLERIRAELRRTAFGYLKRQLQDATAVESMLRCIDTKLNLSFQRLVASTPIENEKNANTVLTRSE